MHFDGLCQPVNPGGIACYAFLVREAGRIIHSEYGLAAKPYSKDSTNNVAEYTALIKALEWLAATKRQSEQVRIASDSRLVVNQVNGQFKVKSARILHLYRRAMSLKESFQDIVISWVPREQNKEADALTNRAYSEASKVPHN